MYLIVFMVYLRKVLYQSLLEQSFIQYTRYRYGTKFRYQSIRPPLTYAQGGLLLGVWDGGRVVRYRTLYLPKKSLKVWRRWIGAMNTLHLWNFLPSLIRTQKCPQHRCQRLNKNLAVISKAQWIFKSAMESCSTVPINTQGFAWNL
jgi:hypothetical protein